jgi:hypothetical protein
MLKVSSSEVSSSAIVYTGHCLYYGFTCVTGGSARTIKLYDALAASGTIVESFVCAADKPTDGHSHSNPVECTNGIYLSMSGGTVVVFYAPLPNATKEGARLTI